MSRRSALLSVLKPSIIYTNFVSNGNFVDIGSWTPLNSTRTASGNKLTITGNGTLADFQVYQNTAQTRVGQKVYSRIKLKSTSADCTKIDFNVGGLTTYTIGTPTINTLYDGTGLTTMINNSTTLTLNIRAYYADAATANGKAIEVQDVMCVNLTAVFGAGSEPTKAWCDANLPFVVTNGIAYI